MRILLDLDGILADYYGAICSLFNYRGPLPLGEDYLPDILRVDEALYHEYVHGADQFWLNLALTSDANQILSIVESFDKDYFICTKPTNHPHGNNCASEKITWIRNHLGHDRYILTTDKSQVITPDRVLIDDHEGNTKHFGRNGFLYPRRWNRRNSEVSSALIHMEDFLRQRFY